MDFKKFSLGISLVVVVLGMGNYDISQAKHRAEGSKPNTPEENAAFVKAAVTTSAVDAEIEAQCNKVPPPDNAVVKITMYVITQTKEIVLAKDVTEGHASEKIIVIVTVPCNKKGDRGISILTNPDNKSPLTQGAADVINSAGKALTASSGSSDKSSGGADKNGGAGDAAADTGFPAGVPVPDCEGKKDGQVINVDVRVPNGNAKDDFSNAKPVKNPNPADPKYQEGTKIVTFHFKCQGNKPVADNDSDRKAKKNNPQKLDASKNKNYHDVGSSKTTQTPGHGNWSPSVVLAPTQGKPVPTTPTRTTSGSRNTPRSSNGFFDLFKPAVNPAPKPFVPYVPEPGDGISGIPTSLPAPVVAPTTQKTETAPPGTTPANPTQPIPVRPAPSDTPLSEPESYGIFDMIGDLFDGSVGKIFKIPVPEIVIPIPKENPPERG